MSTRKNNDYLSHYGIPGMQKGRRRFQNEDGSLTSAGRIRYDQPAQGGQKLSIPSNRPEPGSTRFNRPAPGPTRADYREPRFASLNMLTSKARYNMNGVGAYVRKTADRVVDYVKSGQAEKDKRKNDFRAEVERGKRAYKARKWLEDNTAIGGVIKQKRTRDQATDSRYTTYGKENPYESSARAKRLNAETDRQMSGNRDLRRFTEVSAQAKEYIDKAKPQIHKKAGEIVRAASETYDRLKANTKYYGDQVAKAASRKADEVGVAVSKAGKGLKKKAGKAYKSATQAISKWGKQTYKSIKTEAKRGDGLSQKAAQWIVKEHDAAKSGKKARRRTR